MNLNELLLQRPSIPTTHVPEWMMGCWKRRSISFFNGLTDLQTPVFWIQCRNLTIDLRLPVQADQPPHRALNAYSPQQLEALSQYEGWAAPAHWDGTALSWAEPLATLQVHNRWPEPALLARTGNCLIEHSPSGAYVEDWRLQNAGRGVVVGLSLEEEREVSTGRVLHKGGALILCGSHAGLVLGRPQQPSGADAFPHLVSRAAGDAEALEELFAFETSVAALQGGAYRVSHSTNPGRIGQELTPLDGFEIAGEGRLVQTLKIDGVRVERTFRVDSLEPEFVFLQHTKCSDEAARWYESESRTLSRYLQPIY